MICIPQQHLKSKLWIAKRAQGSGKGESASASVGGCGAYQLQLVKDGRCTEGLVVIHVDDTKTHASSTSKQRKAGSSRETAKPRHSARQGDLMGSLVVSTDENRDRIKTGPRSSELGVSPVKGVPESSRLRPSQTTAI